MKTTIITLLILLITLSAWSQGCSKFYPFSEGTTSQITTTGKNGKVAAITNYHVSSVSQQGSAEVASMTVQMNDKRGELISESKYDMHCTGNAVSIDMNSMMSPQIFEQFKDAEMEVTGTNVVLPNDLVAGQKLPDANVHVKINLSGINMNMDVSMTDREVVGTESVTTPAGTFDCFVITYTSHLKMGVNQTGSAKQWISEGVGLVKHEDYNKRGKVTSSSLLTSFTE